MYFDTLKLVLPSVILFQQEIALKNNYENKHLPSREVDRCENVIIVDVELAASFLVSLSFRHDRWNV